MGVCFSFSLGVLVGVSFLASVDLGVSVDVSVEGDEMTRLHDEVNAAVKPSHIFFRKAKRLMC